MDQCERPEPPINGTEKEVLSGFLDFLRETILCKANGLTDEEVRRPHEPSGLTLLGLVKHLAYVEQDWFRRVFQAENIPPIWSAEDPDADWRIEPDDTTEGIMAQYRDEIGRAQAIVRDHHLDDVAEAPRRTSMEGLQLRWIVTHMIEETARHCGHADLMREAIDGQLGE